MGSCGLFQQLMVNTVESHHCGAHLPEAFCRMDKLKTFHPSGYGFILTISPQTLFPAICKLKVHCMLEVLEVFCSMSRELMFSAPSCPVVWSRAGEGTPYPEWGITPVLPEKMGLQQGPVCRVGPGPVLSWEVVSMLVRQGPGSKASPTLVPWAGATGLKTVCVTGVPELRLNCVKQVCRFGFSPATNRNSR